MKINIAVCGKFHYFNYVKDLYDEGILQRFFYAHKYSSNSQHLKIPQKALANIWIKEYLIHIHLRLFGNIATNKSFSLYHDLWQNLALRQWQKCHIFHVMLHGTSRELIARAKSEGAIVIGEPVNSHPKHLEHLLKQEYENLKIAKKWPRSISGQRLAQEACMCDHILTSSKFVANSFKHCQKPLYTLPWGVNLKLFTPLLENRPKEIFRVICVAQISVRKGHFYLLEAWKKLALSNAELVLIGAIHKEMKPILKKYQNFVHIPRVSHDKLANYYNASSIFILPSIEDGFGYVCTEAMACGLPIIVTENVGASDIVSHGIEGFIVPIRSSNAIATYLEKLYSNRELQQQMGKAALQKSQQLLGWDTYTAKLKQIYSKIYRK